VISSCRSTIELEVRLQLVSSITTRTSARWAALALVVAAQFMVVLDISIVNVALAAIKSDLHFSEESLQWVISAYAIVFGGFLLLGGRLADLLGRRRIFITGVLVFTLTSALCGFAWSAGSLVGFRALEGLGGALFAPAGLSLLMTTFPAGRDRNVALGIWGAASGSGAAVGVVLGGVLTSYLSWPWIFFINVPVGIAIVALAPRYLTESRGALGVHRHFDFAGAVTVTGSLMLLVYALTEAATHGWGSASTVALLAASGVLAASFVAIERRAAAPLLPFRVFRGSRLGAANVITCIIACIAFSQFFLLTLYMQQVLHYSAAQTGVAFTAIAVTVAVMSNVAQRLVTAFGARRVLAAGLSLSAIAAALLVRLPVHGHYATDLLPSFILAGAGLGVSFISVTIAGLESVTPADAGVASGLVNTSRQVGGAIGLAIVSTIATSYAGGGSAAASLTHGFRISFAALALLAVAGAVLTGAMLRRPAPQTPAEESLELAEAA
jgi:EmrB/QacA subfamily drug resistance transporter